MTGLRVRIGFTVKCLCENRLRFFLTVLSISVAVSSVLLINAVSSCGAEAVWEELDSLGMNGLIVTGGGSNLHARDAAALGDIAGVECAAPVTVDASKVYTGGESVNAMVWGIDESAQNVVKLELLHGRFIDKGDVRANSRVCMIDESLAVQLCGNDNAVGKTVELLSGNTVRSFRVVGVVKTGKGIMQSVMGSYFPAFLYAPYTSFHTGEFSQIFLKTDGAVSTEKIGGEVEKTLGPTVEVTDLASGKGALESMLSVVTLVLTVIGAISLVVSGISIMNIMLISVNERTKEIGIKKSIGASGGDILLDFLLESVIIAFTGTLAGIATAALLLLAASAAVKSDIALSLRSAAVSVVMAAALGAAFGIFPAYKASRFKPVEALRR